MAYEILIIANACHEATGLISSISEAKYDVIMDRIIARRIEPSLNIKPFSF